MTENEEKELLILIRDNNKILKDIWNYLNNPNDDIKDFTMNILANLAANKIEQNKGCFSN